MVVILSLLVLLIWTTAYSQQFSGRVISRSGTPQAGCQVEFTGPNQAPLRVVTNRDGNFYVNLRQGQYRVWVRLGQLQHSLQVTVDNAGLHPSTFIVNW